MGKELYKYLYNQLPTIVHCFFKVLPPLVDVISEARLNLVIYFLRQDDVTEAYTLIKDLEPTVPQEYILKGVVNAAVGQDNGSREHLKIAQQYFQLVGGSASECDTIPGRSVICPHLLFSIFVGQRNSRNFIPWLLFQYVSHTFKSIDPLSSENSN